MKTTVKCNYSKCPCENHNIQINSISIKNAVRYDKKYYHSDCFIKMIQKKINNCNSESDRHEYEVALENIKSYMEEAYKFLVTMAAKNELNSFLINSYNIKSVSSYMWVKLNGVFIGDYKNLHGKGIPPEHLVDMWKRRIHSFKKNQQKMIVKGKKLSPQQQMSYDLEVLISGYESYLKWLNEKKINEEGLESTSDVKTVFLTKNIKTKAENNTVDDEIQDIVDDIFDD